MSGGVIAGDRENAEQCPWCGNLHLCCDAECERDYKRYGGDLHWRGVERCTARPLAHCPHDRDAPIGSMHKARE